MGVKYRAGTGSYDGNERRGQPHGKRASERGNMEGSWQGWDRKQRAWVQPRDTLKMQRGGRGSCIWLSPFPFPLQERDDGVACHHGHNVADGVDHRDLIESSCDVRVAQPDAMAVRRRQKCVGRRCVSTVPDGWDMTENGGAVGRWASSDQAEFETPRTQVGTCTSLT